jgi:hypothetical protein
MAQDSFLGLRAVGGLLSAVALFAGCAAPSPHLPPPVYLPQRGGGEPPAAQGPMFFYPERGQTEAQQDRDRYECYRWAVRETGFDPGMTAVRQTASPLPPPPSGAGVAAGAATGAVVGAAVTGPRHGPEGIVLGAIFGGALGAMAEQSQARAAADAQARHAQAVARAQQPLADFRRAMGACMAGRGYRGG